MNFFLYALKWLFFLSVTLFLLPYPALSEKIFEEKSHLRIIYPDVKTISSLDLYERFHDVMLIDVRSSFEFDVISIASSVNLPIKGGWFISKIKKLAKYQPDIDVVFLDNNIECSRGFEAARMAKKLGLNNVMVYDAGIFSWLTHNKKWTKLMGVSPASIDDVLPPIEHQQHLIDFEQLKAISADQKSLVIDTRDNYHRIKDPNDIELKHVELVPFIQAINNRIWSEKKLVIFDSDGKENKLLHLFLKSNGYNKYFFLRGGLNNIPSGNFHDISIQELDSIEINQEHFVNVTSKLWGIEHCSNLFNLIISSIHFNSVSYFNPVEISKNLGVSIELIENLSIKLSEFNLVKFIKTEREFVYLVDPLIAWKGEMEGVNWEKHVQQFHPEE